MFNYSIAPASENELTSTGGMPVTAGVDGAVSLFTGFPLITLIKVEA